MTTAIDRISAPNAPGPGWVGQGTAIEQSRAIEEVRAAMVVAQQCPRNEDAALAAMRRSCARHELADRAFYAFPRAGETVSGESVHLARELARCWGNISHGVTELRRDDAAGISEMQAFAWDLQTNVRSAHVFIVPHKRDTRQGVRHLTDMRDIYENNANNGARRMREAIFAVLPLWFTAEAVALCHKTISGLSGEELAQSIERAVRAYDRAGISVDQLEAKVGRPRAEWTGQEYAQLDVLYGSLKRNEISRDEAFPGKRLTGDEVRADAEPVNVPPTPDGDPAPTDGPVSRRQQNMMFALFGKVEMTDRDDRLRYVNEVLAEAVGADRRVDSTNDLTAAEAGYVIDKLQKWADQLEPEDGDQ